MTFTMPYRQVDRMPSALLLGALLCYVGAGLSGIGAVARAGHADMRPRPLTAAATPDDVAKWAPVLNTFALTIGGTGLLLYGRWRETMRKEAQADEAVRRKSLAAKIASLEKEIADERHARKNDEHARVMAVAAAKAEVEATYKADLESARRRIAELEKARDDLTAKLDALTATLCPFGVAAVDRCGERGGPPPSVEMPAAPPEPVG